MAATHFFIRGIEVGGSKNGQLQYLNGSNEWVSLGNWSTNNGVVIINSIVNPIEINYSIFLAGETYSFRLIDNDGLLISNVIQYRFYTISSYAAGTSTISANSSSGDNWEFGFKIAPDNPPQLPSGYTIDGYEYSVVFCSSGNETIIDFGNKTADYDSTTSGNGAGVYYLELLYNVTNGIDSLQFQVTRMIKVDNAGNILYNIEDKGVIVNSVNGLDIDVSAQVVQTGVSYPIEWLAFDGSSLSAPLATTANATFTVPVGTISIYANVVLGAEFTADVNGNLASSTMVTIN